METNELTAVVHGTERVHTQAQPSARSKGPALSLALQGTPPREAAVARGFRSPRPGNDAMCQARGSHRANTWHSRSGRGRWFSATCHQVWSRALVLSDLPPGREARECGGGRRGTGFGPVRAGCSGETGGVSPGCRHGLCPQQPRDPRPASPPTWPASVQEAILGATEGDPC